MDPITPALATGAARAADAVAQGLSDAKLAEKLFGRAFETAGGILDNELREWNMGRIARKAARRAAPEGPKVVHARVAYRILQDGSLCNDDTMQEYLAGLTAGSFSTDGADDRASYYVDLVARLPAAQVRLHHAIYTALASAGPSEYYGDGDFLDMRTVFCPLEAAAAVLGHPEDVLPSDAVAEAMVGLHREGLIDTYAVAERERFASVPVENTGMVVMARPNGLGIMLALWAHGIRSADVYRIIDTAECDFDPPGPTLGTWAFKIDGPIKNLAQPLIT